jgi:hypothetical protein
LALFTENSTFQNLEANSKMSFGLPPFFGGIGAGFQILDIQQHAAGWKLSPAAPVAA